MFPAPYRNAKLPVEGRVIDLLARMTLVEKCAQLIGPFGLDHHDDGTFSLEFARQQFRHGISYINTHHRKRNTRQTVAYLNAMQKFLREETRLSIPALGIGEGLHGYMAHEATSFPQAIGLASAWDVDLHQRVFEVVAREMRARGAHYVLSPVLDLARDPRWGRTEETYGEDPYLVSRLGVAAVRGLQGERFTGAPEHVLATAKHFAAHGQPEAGTNAGPANYAERILREELFAPFEAVVREGKIGTVMASYNEINGIPSHVNAWLLKDLLRGEWGFEGFVISDGWGVDDLYRLHFVAGDAAEAAVKSFTSGVDVELGRCFRHLEQAVESGRISQATLDAAVTKVLRVKFQLGLFENPFVDEENAVTITNSAEHKSLALEAAHKSIILLKNEDSLLPLDRSTLHSLAVIGPNAAPIRLGGYSGDPGCSISVLEGIRQKVGETIDVLYAEGCGITRSTNDAGQMWHDDEVLLPDPERDAELIVEAIDTAMKSDIVLLILGDNEQTCREGWSTSHLGDRDTLDLPGRQEELLRAVYETGKPIILLLINGRPASINFAAEHIPAILEGWYLGQEAGRAVADVLFGDVNPGGKLPITFPRSVGQIPAYYYHKPSARRGYLFSSVEPLFPFGHGLSYTTFAYSNLRLSTAKISPDETTTLSVDVSNTGDRAGDEVVQFYVHDLLSELVTRPVKLLKGFQRITLQAGEICTVSFPVGREQLQFLDESMQLTVEPGQFELMVGGSSEVLEAIILEVSK
ncbi:MAG TPA: glycoside hydrolase family 3 N-terminal domain-containing protein [Anaerolineales bacterium]|nr:glycoside hydrolase family 3 N-terminal domain-containing protein [Anaerolineales bacterium]